MSTRFLALKTESGEAYVSSKSVSAIWAEGDSVNLSLICGRTFTNLPYESPQAVLKELGDRYRESKQRGRERKHKHKHKHKGRNRV
jgi:hypothetical protein